MHGVSIPRADQDESAAALERLQQLDERRSRFVTLAAHELRAPATVIHGISTTLAQRDGLDARQVALLHDLLHEQTGRLVQLMDQLLDLSRLDEGAVPIERRRVRLRERIERLVAATAGSRAGEVEIRVDPELQASVDPNALDRIVGNLVSNALRYGHAPVCVAADRSDRHVRLTVEDRGPGVSPAFQPRLFERFARDTDASGGAGLGLSIAQQYAVAHGGQILYERGDPHGARFRVVLPAAAA